MRKLATLATLLFLSIPLPLLAQYVSSGVNGDFKDITSYCTTGTNCWYNIPGQCLLNTLGIGGDGYLACIGTDHDIYNYDPPTKTWIGHSDLGSGNTRLAVANYKNVYILGPGGPSWAICQTQGPTSMSILQWNGASLTGISGCLVTISAGTEGSFGGVNISNNAYFWPDGVNGYQLPGTGWTMLSVSDHHNFCGVKSGVLYWQTGEATAPAAFSPSPGTVTGCTFSAYLLGSAAADLMVWGSFGVKTYNFTTATWSTVSGLTPTQLVGVKLGGVFALDSTGHLYHYNVMARHASMTMAGSLNQCPGNQSCPPGATHKVSAHIYFPHDLSGYKMTQSGSPTTQISATSDAIADPRDCDSFFGNDCDPTAPTIDNQALCLVTGAILTQGPLPPRFDASIDAKSYDGSIVEHYTVPLGPGGDITVVVCSATNNACKIGTHPTCPQTRVTVQEVCGGLACDPATELADAEAKCAMGYPTSAWVLATPYSPGVPNSCVNTAQADPVLRVQSYGQIPCD